MEAEEAEAPPPPAPPSPSSTTYADLPQGAKLAVLQAAARHEDGHSMLLLAQVDAEHRSLAMHDDLWFPWLRQRYLLEVHKSLSQPRGPKKARQGTARSLCRTITEELRRLKHPEAPAATPQPNGSDAASSEAQDQQQQQLKLTAEAELQLVRFSALYTDGGSSDIMMPDGTGDVWADKAFRCMPNGAFCTLSPVNCNVLALLQEVVPAPPPALPTQPEQQQQQGADLASTGQLPSTTLQAAAAPQHSAQPSASTPPPQPQPQEHSVQRAPRPLQWRPDYEQHLRQDLYTDPSGLLVHDRSQARHLDGAQDSSSSSSSSTQPALSSCVALLDSITVCRFGNLTCPIRVGAVMAGCVTPTTPTPRQWWQATAEQATAPRAPHDAAHQQDALPAIGSVALSSPARQPVASQSQQQQQQQATAGSSPAAPHPWLQSVARAGRGQAGSLPPPQHQQPGVGADQATTLPSEGELRTRYLERVATQPGCAALSGLTSVPSVVAAVRQGKLPRILRHTLLPHGEVLEFEPAAVWRRREQVGSDGDDDVVGDGSEDGLGEDGREAAGQPRQGAAPQTEQQPGPESAVPVPLSPVVWFRFFVQPELAVMRRAQAMCTLLHSRMAQSTDPDHEVWGTETAAMRESVRKSYRACLMQFYSEALPGSTVAPQGPGEDERGVTLTCMDSQGRLMSVGVDFSVMAKPPSLRQYSSGLELLRMARSVQDDPLHATLFDTQQPPVFNGLLHQHLLDAEEEKEAREKEALLPQALQRRWLSLQEGSAGASSSSQDPAVANALPSAPRPRPASGLEPCPEVSVALVAPYVPADAKVRGVLSGMDQAGGDDVEEEDDDHATEMDLLRCRLLLPRAANMLCVKLISSEDLREELEDLDDTERELQNQDLCWVALRGIGMALPPELRLGNAAS